MYRPKRKSLWIISLLIAASLLFFSIRSFSDSANAKHKSTIGPVSDRDAAVNWVFENCPKGTTVGITATATDLDSGDNVSYALDDNGDGRFAIDPASGVVTVAGNIDQVVGSSYSLTIRATSSDGSFSSKTFLIKVGTATTPEDDNHTENHLFAKVDLDESVGDGTNLFGEDADGLLGAGAAKAVYDGIIEPHVVIELGSPAEGIIDEVLVDRSSMVKKGQPLVKLDSSVERANFNKASAMARFDGELGLQKEQLEYARRVNGRVKPLHSISPQDKDQAATDVILTEKRLKKARENSELAKLERKRAGALLAHRTIKSPITGVVVQRYVSVGEHVNNQPVLRLAQINPLRVEAIVPAQLFGKIVPGMQATVFPELKKYGQQKATVTLVDRVIDPASHTFGVRLNLPNEDNRIPSGLRCLVRFDVTEDTKTANKIASSGIND